VPRVCDHSALALADFVCGANEKRHHLTGVKLGAGCGRRQRLRICANVVAGDPSPTGKGRLKIARGIEVGHIFQLGRKYSEPMKALVLDEAGRETALYMGCYGIGVTRIVAAAIEQNHDERGIIWPAPIAPFQVVLVPLNLQKSARVRESQRPPVCRAQRRRNRGPVRRPRRTPGCQVRRRRACWAFRNRLVVADRGLEAGRLEYRQATR